MFNMDPAIARQALLDWHEVAALRTFTSLSGELVELFAATFAEREALTAQLMQIAAVLVDRAPMAEQEFVGDELAAAMNVHPATGQRFVATALRAFDLPGLMEALERADITERHVHAALDALPATLPEEVTDAVITAVLTRLRDGARRGREWPTPGGLRQALRRELLLHDLPAAQEREKAATERRGMHLDALPDGQAALSLHGPALTVLAMAEAIRAHARAAASDAPTDGAVAGSGEGVPRTLEQRQFDAAADLLLAPIGGAGGDSGKVGVRVEAQILVPFSTARGGDLELAELVGYGPILPATARSLLDQAAAVRRVCVDAVSGQVIAVDDATLIATEQAVAARESAIQAAVEAMATDPVLLRDLSTASYRPTMRLVRQIRLRDRTCTFPGCTRLARYSDLDHREAWPGGSTAEGNLHCLCRHHHRAKQARFAVSRAPDGSTLWSSTTGQTYRRPPPEV